MITVVDSGVANLGSILNMLKRIGVDSRVSRDPGLIRDADKLILPGVGAFDAGMAGLRRDGLSEALDEAVTRRAVPVLGLCLGMQLMGQSSEEGSSSGLGWIDVRCVRFAFPSGLLARKVPHMGWNTVEVQQPHPIFAGLHDARFYFVHSFHAVAADEANVLARTEYGEKFPSSIVKDNIIGMQFHPEKSHRFGMQLLRNFAERV